MAVSWETTDNFAHNDSIRIDLVQCEDGGYYAVRLHGHCLGQDGKWHYESFPSQRTESFLRKCRFRTLPEAIKLIELADKMNPKPDAKYKRIPSHYRNGKKIRGYLVKIKPKPDNYKQNRVYCLCCGKESMIHAWKDGRPEAFICKDCEKNDLKPSAKGGKR